MAKTLKKSLDYLSTEWNSEFYFAEEFLNYRDNTKGRQANGILGYSE